MSCICTSSQWQQFVFQDVSGICSFIHQVQFGDNTNGPQTCTTFTKLFYFTLSWENCHTGGRCKLRCGDMVDVGGAVQDTDLVGQPLLRSSEHQS